MTLFPKLIYKDRFTGLDTLETIKVCENFPMSRIGLENGPTARSSVLNPFIQPAQHPHFKSYYDWLLPRAIRIITEEWGLADNIHYIVGESWINCHGRDDKTLEHNHGMAAMAVSHYISYPPNSGRIEFKDPSEVSWRFYPKKSNHYDGWYPLDIETNDTVMFPSWLPHRTEVNKSDEDRWVLTTNIICFKTHFK
jgi:uncharacterized protein (TIGR02466 family)